ncbi:hypothetical protein DXG03_002606 [Asterophora parasitica]|uniref:N-end rule aminoacyl transferase C-terminal domain-containing protein n=1 Tax=Asterophora parasitica TaxID=117018 RepID=A0A9P7G2R4_9AGAR|nr:hypothetical protein DXG03_002606 [Asterophora parasitica]
MENPHAERQAILLERILKNTSKCTEMVLELNHCMEYTIRLDARAFKASKRQRKLVNRWNRYVISGKDSEHMDDDGQSPTASKKKKPHPKTKTPEFSLCDAIHASEAGFIDGSGSVTGSEAPFHSFETTLEPSTYTDEKYALFEQYQRSVHHDNTTPGGFKRFLVDSPLIDKRIPYPSSDPPAHLPKTYGSYHQLYRVDGTLVAMGVIDVLPACVSSVYFMYDHEKWEKFSFGKLSALREISLVQEMNEAGAPGMEFLYMGFYIHTCPKMRYKGEYAPSYLADPETYTWHPLPSCVALLDKQRYACFERPDWFTRSGDSGSPPPMPPPPSPPPPDEAELGIELEHVQAVSQIKDNTLWIAPVAVRAPVLLPAPSPISYTAYTQFADDAVLGRLGAARGGRGVYTRVGGGGGEGGGFYFLGGVVVF